MTVCLAIGKFLVVAFVVAVGKWKDSSVVGRPLASVV